MIINRGYQKLTFITKAASLNKFQPLINYLENEMTYDTDLKFIIVKKETKIQQFLTGHPVKMAQGFVKDLLHEDDSVIIFNPATQELDEVATVNNILYKNQNEYF